MKDLFLKHRNKGIALLLCVVPLILLATSAGATVGQERRIRPTRWSWSALSFGQLAVVDGFSSVSSWFGDEELINENSRLQAENATLREEKARLIGVLQENERLRRLVDFKQTHSEYTLVPAQVIARDTTPFFRVLSIRLKPPRQVVLRPRQPVLIAGGVVGQVHEVHEDYAQVLLLSDPRSQIDVISQRNRAHGITSGLGHERDYHARVSYLSEKDQVRPGDVMVTSGMGGGFPPELIVGQVLTVAPDERGLFQNVVIEPAVDFSRLEEVFIMVGTRDQELPEEEAPIQPADVVTSP